MTKEEIETELKAMYGKAVELGDIRLAVEILDRVYPISPLVADESLTKPVSLKY